MRCSFPHICHGVAAAALILLLAGCRTHTVAPLPAGADMRGLVPQDYLETVEAMVVPPAGWLPEQLKASDRHTHQVWVSPTGRTAYGVICFKLPIPVGPGTVLWVFMREMRRVEGEGTLIERVEDPDLPGIRFVAEGGRYKLRTNLTSRGFRAWAIYAGTMRTFADEPLELELAERARELTRVGKLRRGDAAAATTPIATGPN